MINKGISKKLKFVQRILRMHAYMGNREYWMNLQIDVKLVNSHNTTINYMAPGKIYLHFYGQ